jgi:hypothetical protein
MDRVGRDRAAAAWVAAGGLAIYLVLCLTSMRAKSCTFDEVIHLPPGYVSWTLGDHRMNPDHPPLVRRIAALPLLFMDVTVRTDDHAWATSRPWEFGKRFLFRWNDANRLLFWGRLAVVIFVGGALAVAVFAWARRLWGLLPASFALFLFVLNPDMIAHGQIVTNDLGIALFLFLSVMTFEWVTERVTLTRTLLAGLALGAAVGTKFSGVALLPILLLLAVVVALRPEPLVVEIGRRRREIRGRGDRLALMGAVLVAMAPIALLVVWASYGFHSPLSPEPAVDAAFDWASIQPPDPFVRGLLALVRRWRIVPEAWTYGFLHFLEHSQTRPAFLMGEYSETGWHRYFLMTFALKTPLPLLVLGLAALILAVRAGGPDRRAWLFVWLPFALYFTMAMTRSINIGHRHLLPIYPFLFVAVGACVRAVAEAVRNRRRGLALGALAALVGWYAIGTLRLHPHYLAYFNELAGGPANGYRYLVDSNLDWGQDLIGLRDFMKRTGVPRLKLLYFGTADPAYYGVSCDRLPGYQPPPPSTLVHEVRPGDLVAVSATHLQGLYLEPPVRALAEKLRAQRPLAVIGYALFVYRAEFVWLQGDEKRSDAASQTGATPPRRFSSPL